MRSIRSLARRAIDRTLSHTITRHLQDHDDRQRWKPDKGTQTLLRLKYRQLLQSASPLPALAEVGFRAFSQYDEDGILLYLLTLAEDAIDRRCIEIGCGHGIQSNTANLIVNWNWRGLMVDGSDENIVTAKRFFETHPDTMIDPPKCVREWVTAENVNSLIEANGFGGRTGVLSIDIDGNDYWVWKAITACNPSIVVVEYHTGWAAGERMAVRYSPQFTADWGSMTVGASLSAFSALASERGYRLVGCNRHDFNAFYVQSDLVPRLPTRADESCLASRRCAEDRNRFARVRDLDQWVHV